MATKNARITLTDVIIAFMFLAASALAFYSLLQKNTRLGLYSTILASLLFCIIGIFYFVHVNKLQEFKNEPSAPSTETEIVPKAFYYLDEQLVKDLYYQIHLDPELKQVETEETNSSEKGLSAKLIRLEPTYGRMSSSKTRKIFESNIKLSVMYNHVEKLLRTEGLLDEGIQFFIRSNQPILEIQEMCKVMHEKFNFDFPKDLQEKLILQYLNTAANSELKRLCEKSGYVLVEEDFNVSDLDEKFCCLKFEHPLNDFLETKEPPVSISVHCDVSSLTPSGRTTFKKEEATRITCVGKIVRWKQETRSLVIRPLAIF